MGWLDDMQKKKASEDRAFLEGCVEKLKAVSFQPCRGKIDDMDLAKYNAQLQKFIRSLNSADTTRTDTWNVDHELEKIIGELTEAARTHSQQTIESCLLALGYATSVRVNEIPRHQNQREEMEKRLSRLDIYTTIIACSKAIDNAKRSLEQQKREQVRVDREREAARAAAIRLREEEPAAAEEVDTCGGEVGHAFTGKAQEIQTLMNNALDLRDRLTELEQMIARNKQMIQSLESQIEQSRIQLTQRDVKLSREELDKIAAAQEHMLHQMASMQEEAEKLRAQTRGSAEQIRAMAASEEVVMSMMRTSEAFRKAEQEIEEKALRDAEAKGRMLEQKRLEAERRAQRERILQEQIQHNEQILVNLAPETQEVTEEEELTY